MSQETISGAGGSGTEALVTECVMEARRIEESADFSAQVQFEAAKYWGGLATSLSLLASVAAFASGATILQAPEWHTAAGLLAFIAGAIGVVNTVTRGQEKAADCARSGRAFRRVRDMARQVANIDSLGEVESLRQRLHETVSAFNIADEQAPIVGWAFWAVWRARRNLTSGLTKYRVDGTQ
jgi:hypothetical protein